MLTSGTPYAIALSTVNCRTPAPLHWHRVYEISYVVNGTGTFVLEGEEFPFSPGAVHIINSVHQHMVYADDEATLFNLHFPPELLRLQHVPLFQQGSDHPFDRMLERFTPPLSANDPRNIEVVELLEAIRREHAAQRKEWVVVVLGLLLQTVGVLMRHCLDTQPQPPDLMRQHATRQKLVPALRLLEVVDLETPTPSLAELAREVELSPSHFSALFRETLGDSPIAYRNRRRIELARQMLLETQAPVNEIAGRCGFATMQQFNRLFLKTLGITPGGYRRTARGSVSNASSRSTESGMNTDL
jgi:AraC-like DNA-binding protein